MIDMATHSVLFARNADEAMHPSSMSKLMTLELLFQRLKDGRVKLSDQFVVSERAWRTAGSTGFTRVGDGLVARAQHAKDDSR